MDRCNFASDGTRNQDYPKREKFFALKFIRLLHSLRIAAELGQDVLSLLTFVALKEDELRYKPVPMYSAEPQAALGFKKWERLKSARAKAVAAGWLTYQEPPRGSRQAGIYWVTIPKDVPTIETQNNTPTTDIVTCTSPQNGDCQGERQSPGNGYCQGEHSYPFLKSPILKTRNVLKTLQREEAKPKKATKAQLRAFPDCSSIDFKDIHSLLILTEIMQEAGFTDHPRNMKHAAYAVDYAVESVSGFYAQVSLMPGLYDILDEYTVKGKELWGRICKIYEERNSQ